MGLVPEPQSYTYMVNQDYICMPPINPWDLCFSRHGSPNRGSIKRLWDRLTKSIQIILIQRTWIISTFYVNLIQFWIRTPLFSLHRIKDSSNKILFKYKKSSRSTLRIKPAYRFIFFSILGICLTQVSIL